MFKNYELTLDIATGDARHPLIQVNTNDLDSFKISFIITQHKEPVDLTGKTIRIAILKPDRKTVLQDCALTDAENGKGEVILDTQAYALGGKHYAEVMVYDGAEKVAVTGRFVYNANRGILNDGTVESTNEWQSINQAIADAENILIDLRENGTGVDAQARQDLETVTAQLAQKVTQGESGAVTWAMAAQDFREQITGGNTAVVGVDSVLTENLVNKSVTPEKTVFFDDPINLFDKNSSELLIGFYVLSSGEVASENYNTTPPVKVSVGDVINTNIISDGSASVGIVYDENGNYLAKVEGFANNTVIQNVSIVNSGARFVKFNIRLAKNNMDNIMITKNMPIPEVYTPFTKDVFLTESIRMSTKQFTEIRSEYNELTGKTALFNGDSICYGDGYLGGYAKIIGDKNGMPYVNYGVAGGTIASETYKTSGSPRHWVNESIGDMQSEADYIILQGGINDYWLSVPLGAITSDYASAFDNTTFCGALESTLKQSVLKWKGKKIGFIISQKISNTFYPYGATSSGKSELYWQKAREICEKWSIPYLDLFKESGLNANIPEINDLYFKHNETGTGDKTHPNEAGYREFLAPKIEAWMKTL